MFVMVTWFVPPYLEGPPSVLILSSYRCDVDWDYLKCQVCLFVFFVFLNNWKFWQGQLGDESSFLNLEVYMSC